MNKPNILEIFIETFLPIYTAGTDLKKFMNKELRIAFLYMFLCGLSIGFVLVGLLLFILFPDKPGYGMASLIIFFLLSTPSIFGLIQIKKKFYSIKDKLVMNSKMNMVNTLIENNMDKINIYLDRFFPNKNEPNNLNN